MKSCTVAEPTSKLPVKSKPEAALSLLPEPPVGATARALLADYTLRRLIPPGLLSSAMHAFVLSLLVMVIVTEVDAPSSPLFIDTRALTQEIKEKSFEVRRLEEPTVLPKLGTKENLPEKVEKEPKVLEEKKQGEDNPFVAVKGEKATATTDDENAKVVKPIVQPEESAKVRTPDVIYVPTPQPVVDEMLKMAKVKAGDIVMDPGCGDGRIPISAAKLGAWGFGYDIDGERIKESVFNAKKAGVVGRVVFEQRDAFKLDFSRADAVCLYMLPSLNVKLIPQLQRMRPGTRIVSHDFDMEGVKPDLVKRFVAKDDYGNQREHSIYLWTLPLRKDDGSFLPVPEPDASGPLTVTEDEVLWATLGLRVTNVKGGLNVTEVRQFGPAATARIQVGDVIDMLGGFDVTSKRANAIHLMRLNVVYMTFRLKRADQTIVQRPERTIEGDLTPSRWDK